MIGGFSGDSEISGVFKLANQWPKTDPDFQVDDKVFLEAPSKQFVSSIHFETCNDRSLSESKMEYNVLSNRNFSVLKSREFNFSNCDHQEKDRPSFFNFPEKRQTLG